MKRRFAFFIALLVLCVPALFADTLTFAGTTLPSPNPGYLGMVNPGGVFTLIAPIQGMAVNTGPAVLSDAVFVLTTGSPSSVNGSVVSYTTGGFALYALSDWNFGSESGTNPLLTGLLGDSALAVLQGTPPNLGNVFAGKVTGGSLLGTFGTVDLTQFGTVNGGGVLSVQLVTGLDSSGLHSVPEVTIFQLTTTPTPEPVSSVLLLSGIGTLFVRRRR